MKFGQKIRKNAIIVAREFFFIWMKFEKYEKKWKHCKDQKVEELEGQQTPDLFPCHGEIHICLCLQTFEIRLSINHLEMIVQKIQNFRVKF
jgi:hypothetical protein